jgi:hypothetical protein
LSSRLVGAASLALSRDPALQLFTSGTPRLRSAPTRRLLRWSVAEFAIKMLPFFFSGASPCRGGFDRCLFGLDHCSLAPIPGLGSYRNGQLFAAGGPPQPAADAPLIRMSQFVDQREIQSFEHRLP